MKNGLVEYPNGTKEWFLNGKQHREDGPAEIYSGGSKFWWVNGQRHREDGPAMIWRDGSKFWLLNGKKLTEEEVKLLKAKLIINQDLEEML